MNRWILSEFNFFTFTKINVGRMFCKRSRYACSTMKIVIESTMLGSRLQSKRGICVLVTNQVESEHVTCVF